MTHYLALGSNIGLSRANCAACGSETMHRRDACVHCGTSRMPVMVRQVKKLTMPVGIRRPYCIEFGGEHLSLKDIAKRAGLAYETVTQRFRNGLRGKDLVAAVPPIRARPKRRAA